MTRHPILRNLHLVLLCLALSACGKHSGNASITPAAPAEPNDAALATLYDSSCKDCHADPASGAPQSGDAKAWAPRLAQGEDTLLDHTINGYQSMPPMGMCMQCSEDDFAALIAFMSGNAQN